MLQAVRTMPEIRAGQADHSSREEVAEQVPVASVEANRLHLLDRTVVRWAGVDADTGQQQREFQIVQIGGFVHDVFTRQIVAALLEDLHQRLRDQVAVYDMLAPSLLSLSG
jgi:hypothetical protein